MMTLSDLLSADELDIRVKERTAELEKAIQALRIENEQIKLRDKQEDKATLRNNRILKGINRIFRIVVQDKSEEELGNECLTVALEVTGRTLGFVDLMGVDGLLHDIAISDMGWEQCLMYDKTGHRRPPGNLILHSSYGSVINSEKRFFTNDPLSHPDSIGVPPGHPVLTSFLGVPRILDKKIIGMVGVANREGGYSSEQQEDLEAIIPAIVQALHRKRAEKDLLEAYENLHVQSEELLKKTEILRAFTQNSHEIVFVKDYQCRNVYANDSLSYLLGKSADEVVGKTDIEFYSDPLIGEAIMENDRKVHETRQPLVIEESVLLPDGSHRIYLSTKSPWLAGNGTLLGIVGFAVGITERKKMEDLLRESEAQLRLPKPSRLKGIGYLTC